MISMTLLRLSIVLINTGKNANELITLNMMQGKEKYSKFYYRTPDLLMIIPIIDSFDFHTSLPII